MIHCDEVFDILTRGPFPTGAPSDGIVEAHLSACGDCRRLAEALRPAIEMFQEAIAPEESRSLPGYRGRPRSEGQSPSLTPWLEAHPTANAPADAPATRKPERASQLRSLRGWFDYPRAPLAAAVLASLTLGAFAHRVIQGPPSADGTAARSHSARGLSSSGDAAATGSNPQQRELLSLVASLPKTCLQNAFSAASVSLPGITAPTRRETSPETPRAVACCTCCHNGLARGPVRSAAAQDVVRNCQVCH